MLIISIFCIILKTSVFVIEEQRACKYRLYVCDLSRSVFALSSLREFFVSRILLKRDKSRPYACRQITTISQIMEDTKPKEIFLVILII